jgi:hypothetical protein
MKEIWSKKGLVVTVIFLFLGVAVAPTINSSIVKASDDLVEVTSQACGIQGYGDTTVKLTRQQYQNLEQYLVEFRARLNQTTTREEAIPIFKDAVVELNKYGLLPKGMSVEKVQRLVIGPSQNLMVKNIIRNSPEDSNFNGIDNYHCFVFGNFSTEMYPLGVFGFSRFIASFLLVFYGMHFLPFQLCGPVVFGRLQEQENMDWYSPARGWMTAIGSNGSTQISGLMFGTLGELESGFGGFKNTYYKGMNSFSGLTLILQGERILLGHTPHIGLTTAK